MEWTGLRTEGSLAAEGPYVAPRAPPFLSSPTPESVSALLGSSHDLRAAVVLRHALEWALTHADVSLLSWLLSLQGELAAILDDQANLLGDDDGWGVVGMSIMGSCGREEREVGVRAVVTRWGLETGPHGGRDRSGWTPLHLAALLSTPPLVSFLLTNGASTGACTHRGLNALDLITGIPQRQDVAVLLESAHGAELDSPGPSSGRPSSVPDDSSIRRRELLLRRRTRASQRLERAERQDARRKLAAEKEIWVRERARVIDVDPELLLPPRPARKSGRVSGDSGLGWGGNVRDDAASDDGGSESEDETDNGESEDDATEDPGYDEMLVFSLPSIESFLTVIVSSYALNCFPLDRRTLPANALFLASKFALYRCDDSWLEELLDRAVDRIEKVIYANVEDVAYLAFWTYNATVLLHLLRGDAGLESACEELGLLSMVEELINALNVHVIRVAERRIDGVLDAALLDHETIDDFDDVRFEGEWSLFRSFAGSKTKKRGTILPKASQLFGGAGDSPGQGSEAGTPPSASPFGSLRDAASAASPFSMRSLRGQQSMQDLGTRTQSDMMLSTEQSSTPQSITDILSAVLLVLQLFQVNPAIVVQTFSQIFYWIACELFNRILTRKKYLCRTKAVQIKMNITALEDWVRFNALPASVASKHLEPVMQLLAWLQCQSQLHDFDALIGTLQSMKALNPLQMRKVVRDYRYEVNEARMSDECSQYLSQLQKDWERREMQAGMQAIQREMKANGMRRERSNSSEMSTGSGRDLSTPVDALFDGSVSLSDFVPQTSPECRGELWDSRFMIPFVLPSRTEWLVATPPNETAYDNTLPPSPFVSDESHKGSRPSSRASFASERPLGWRLPKSRQLRALPDDFFSWLKAKQAEHRRRRPDSMPLEPRPIDLPSPVKIVQPELPARPVSLHVHPLRTVSEDSDATTPLAREAGSYFAKSPRSANSPSSIPRQASLQDSPVHAFAESPQQPRHLRSESYEVQLRQIAAAHLAPHSPRDNGGHSPSADKRRWFGPNRRPSGEKRGLREGSEDTIRETTSP